MITARNNIYTSFRVQYHEIKTKLSININQYIVMEEAIKIKSKITAVNANKIKFA